MRHRERPSVYRDRAGKTVGPAQAHLTGAFLHDIRRRRGLADDGGQVEFGKVESDDGDAPAYHEAMPAGVETEIAGDERSKGDTRARIHEHVTAHGEEERARARLHVAPAIERERRASF